MSAAVFARGPVMWAVAPAMSGRGSWLGVLLLLLRMRGSSDCAAGFASAFACRYEQVEGEPHSQILSAMLCSHSSSGGNFEAPSMLKCKHPLSTIQFLGSFNGIRAVAEGPGGRHLAGRLPDLGPEVVLVEHAGEPLAHHLDKG